MAQPAVKKIRQIDRVRAVLMDGQPRTLWMIRSDILKRFNKMDSEAGISARIRDLRADGLNIQHKPYKGSPSHEYWIGGGE